MPSPEIIAHKILTPKKAEATLESGVGIESDVIPGILRLNAAHNGIWGKAGLGGNPKGIFALETNGYRLLADFKHPRPTLINYQEKMSALAGNRSISICGLDWAIISSLCEKSNMLAFYTLSKPAHLEKIKGMLPHLQQPAGFCVEQRLITPEFMQEFGNNGTLVLAWIVNDVARAKELIRLGVDGIITDNFAKMLAEFKS